MKKKIYQVDSAYAWVIALSSLGLATIGSGIFYLVAIAIVPQVTELGISSESASLPYGAAMVGMGIGGILMGWVADKKGPFGPAIFGSLSIAAGCYLISEIRDFNVIVIVYGLLLGALGNAALVAPLLSNTMLWFKERRGIASAVVGAGNALGGAVWPPILFWWNAQYGFSSCYRAFAIFALITMIPMCFLLRENRPPESVESVIANDGKAQIKSLVVPAHLFVCLLCVAVAGCCIAMSMPMVHLPNYAKSIGFTIEEGAILLSALMTSSVIARIMWGFICDRIGGLKTLISASSLQAIGLIGLTISDGLTYLYLAGIIFGIGFGGILPCYPVILREYLPAEGLGFKVGLVVFFGAFGMALGPEIAGRIYALLNNYSTGFLAGITANIINLTIIGGIIKFGVKRGTLARAFN